MNDILKGSSKLIVPLLILVGIIILNIFAIKIIFDNGSRLNNDLSKSKKEEASLQDKLSSLQNVSPEISSGSDSVVFALPGTNPVLSVTGNIQTYAIQQGLALSGLSSAVTAPSGETNSTPITFTLDGGYSSINSFVLKLTHSAPIVHFSSIKIKKQSEGDNYELSGNVLSFWANLPTTIPAVDDPVTKLTPDEESKLNEIIALEKPLIINTSTATSSGTVGKTNPFQ